MLNEKNDFRLLYQSIQELSSSLGQNQIHINTVSLLFLEMDLEYEFFEKVNTELMKYVAKSDIKMSEVKELIKNSLPPDREFNDIILYQMIIGFAKFYYKELAVISEEAQYNILKSIH